MTPGDVGGATPAVLADLASLAAALDGVVPARTESNLLIGTWNLRAFADLTAKWEAAPSDSPKRDWRAVACIAEVISRFDVVAVQEVRRDTTALRFLLARLGTNWRAITSDVTQGDAGNGERLTFLYESTRIQPSGLVGEIVLPPAAQGPVLQFARTPYAAGFTRGSVGFTRGSVGFTLTTVHVMWGTTQTDRLPEITAFAQWMRAWADEPKDLNENLLVLGDFNLDRIGNPLYEAFVSTGLWPPTELNNVPRTVFDNDTSTHFYDQIAWFSKDTGASLLHGLTYQGKAGTFDFIPHAFAGHTRLDVSWRISDHYPLWIEFQL
ncbi:endonuclease/exonuclease/phosphatase family protein [Paenarthrobacter sp. Z7-10]|uniref:endonuclease/exonuclease/phosphatase family protein n=1 Tax=Paenarthrobacter sp. Z7-10 TaxID=2787635 RepID=UPI0022A9ECCF|nr:endonuclease/exonuclease/phosphatase family protein [Paenarthrobacter sp. Z7-10]MCZ2404210.1 endonuclease/exonuclease/phosphatase family protein [Paenarthrobacter sp. Z7-10]